MELRQLVKEVPYLLETRGNMSVEIAALCSNSREKTENGIFFCFAGAHFDAHQYAPQAVQNGCVALVVERFLDDVNVPQVLVSNGRAAMARICEAFFDHPERKMRFVGITGTKGKTTTSYMVKSICEQAGFKCGLVGTTGNMIGEKHIPSSKTTPDPIDLMRDLNEMVQAGVQVVVMEVSAHALDMHRLDGMTFECGCYTNLSQDHLDYFGTMENYFQCKKAFFTSGMAKNAAINADDERAAELLRDVTIPHMTYGIAAEADLFARDIEITENGVSFELRLRNAEYIQINLRMTGMFNVYNALSAAACALILGVSPENVRAGLESIRSVPGRIEMLPTNTPYRVILDYAHAPDALSNILRTCWCSAAAATATRASARSWGASAANWRICASSPATIRARKTRWKSCAKSKRASKRRRVSTSSSRTVGMLSVTRWKSGRKATSSSCAARVTRRIRRQWASSGRSTRKLSCRSC